MSLDNSAVVPISATAVEQNASLRFEDGDSPYLSKTPSSAGNRKTWTWSAWVKRGNITWMPMFSATQSGTNLHYIFFSTSDTIGAYVETPGYKTGWQTSAVFRDPAAWYHIVVRYDTTQSAVGDRCKIYVNGVEYSTTTSNYSSTYIPQNHEGLINNTNSHKIGADGYYTSVFMDGYMAEVNFIDGQSLAPSNFGETNSTYGNWQPITDGYSGTYGTNGFYLNFSDASSVGDDSSGNGNDFTANNLASTDVVVDSPTNNFQTLNSLLNQTYGTLSEGNLKHSGGADWSWSLGTFPVPTTGKWYWEARIQQTPTNSAQWYVGIRPEENAINSHSNSGLYGLQGNSGTTWGNVDNSLGYGLSAGDIVSIALDSDNNKIYGAINGTWVYTNDPEAGVDGYNVSAIDTKPYCFNITAQGSQQLIANFGQDSSFAGNETAQSNTDSNSIGDFYYEPPTDYLALCTSNLSDPAVVPTENFNTILYTGTGGNRSFTGVGFQPDFVWFKRRSTTGDHFLQDVVRGVSSSNSPAIFTNSSGAEFSIYDPNGGIVSFDSDGFSTAGATTNNNPNWSGVTYAAWNWKAGGSASSNTDGSITSTVSANQDAGFSILTWTGNSTDGATIGHGLSSAPELIITKCRSDAASFVAGIGNLSAFSTNDYLVVNSTNSKGNSSTFYQGYGSSTFTVGVSSADEMNKTGNTYVSYAFHSVEGYSKVGSYVGNGSTDGTFVFTGFRPAYILIKNATASLSYSWYIHDTKMNPYNVSQYSIFPNGNYAESPSVDYYIDINSNGFKLRTDNARHNTDGETYFYIAFAEYPFKYTNAR